VDFIHSPLVQIGAVVLVVLFVRFLVMRRYQRCPHCLRLVRRAHRGWLRCKSCGRQYHRSVQIRR